MNNRFLTITLQPDWQAGLRAAAVAAQKGTYQGEVLNFESPGHFFGMLDYFTHEQSNYELGNEWFMTWTDIWIRNVNEPNCFSKMVRACTKVNKARANAQVKKEKEIAKADAKVAKAKAKAFAKPKAKAVAISRDARPSSQSDG